MQNYHQWSLANKLTFLFSFFTLLIVSIILIVSYIIVQRVIITAEKQYLIDEVHVMQDLLKKHYNQISILENEVNAIPSLLKGAEYHYYIRIFDIHNRTLLKTSGMDEALPNPKFPILSISNWEDKWIHWENDKGQRFISIAAPIQFDNTGKANLFMQMALDGTYPEKLINQYQNYFLFFLFGTTFIILVISKKLAQKGLKNLYDMIIVTEKINTEFLTARIDITSWPSEFKPLGDSLNKMLERIEKGFQRISECISELAHELRTPINNLMLANEIALSRTRKISDYQQILVSNLEEFKHIKNIIDSVLFLTRAANQGFTLNKQELDLKAEITTLCNFYSIAAVEKNIKLVQMVEGKVIADQILLQRAIGNILANAIQHTPKDGEIRIYTFFSQSLSVVSVQDNGIGISKERLDNIFNKFYNINSHQSVSWKHGNGLGLPIVKSIMELHKGEVFITSEVEKGTSVKLIFPYSN